MLPFPADFRRLILSFHNQFNSYPATLYPKGRCVIRKHSVNGAGEDSNELRIVKAEGTGNYGSCASQIFPRW